MQGMQVAGAVDITVTTESLHNNKAQVCVYDNSVGGLHADDAILAAMKTHAQDADVQWTACEALCELAGTSPVACRNLARKNAVLQLTESMRAHVGDARVQTEGAAALGHIVACLVGGKYDGCEGIGGSCVPSFGGENIGSQHDHDHGGFEGLGCRSECDVDGQTLECARKTEQQSELSVTPGSRSGGLSDVCMQNSGVYVVGNHSGLERGTFVAESRHGHGQGYGQGYGHIQSQGQGQGQGQGYDQVQGQGYGHGHPGSQGQEDHEQLPGSVVEHNVKGEVENNMIICHQDEHSPAISHRGLVVGFSPNANAYNRKANTNLPDGSCGNADDHCVQNAFYLDKNTPQNVCKRHEEAKGTDGLHCCMCGKLYVGRHVCLSVPTAGVTASLMGVCQSSGSLARILNMDASGCPGAALEEQEQGRGSEHEQEQGQAEEQGQGQDTQSFNAGSSLSILQFPPPAPSPSVLGRRASDGVLTSVAVANGNNTPVNLRYQCSANSVGENTVTEPFRTTHGLASAAVVRKTCSVQHLSHGHGHGILPRKLSGGKRSSDGILTGPPLVKDTVGNGTLTGGTPLPVVKDTVGDARAVDVADVGLCEDCDSLHLCVLRSARDVLDGARRAHSGNGDVLKAVEKAWGRIMAGAQ
jgi:hypothetical protein